MNTAISNRMVLAASLALCFTAVGANAQQIMLIGSGAAGYRYEVAANGSMTSAVDDDVQAKDELMDGLDKLGANAKERNEVNLDKNMMALAGGRKGGRYAGLSDKMDFIVVRNYEYASKGMYSKADLDTLRRRLDSNGWSHLVRNESEGESNEIVVRTDGDGLIHDMVILNVEPKEVNIVHLRGHFKMEDVNGAMGSMMGMSGSINGMANGLSHSASHSGSRSYSSNSSSTSPNSPPASPAPPEPPSPPRR
ncbi:hypothetical protein Terro_3493 [Terriglobus roseus DSM 18391]|uniref:DUF4252 domain-containing protein n=1 Tax=Terriglobus roseus (strain DSM 18391 / NRRL B-41598 / KBS 63) TaxID=926566 RepID=I3ZKD9_TERRK|nr:DUF4252 domain-containing protein [Terriglobus roseus]AFL89707.1 hypothetical protein Terro_3493 [Terriglobus roseus DSM 18391]